MNTHTASWKTEEETELFPLRHSIHHIVLPFLCLFSGYAYLRVIGSESGFIVLYSLLGGYSVIGATSNRQLGKPSTSKKKALLFSTGNNRHLGTKQACFWRQRNKRKENSAEKEEKPPLCLVALEGGKEARGLHEVKNALLAYVFPFLFGNQQCDDCAQSS